MDCVQSTMKMRQDNDMTSRTGPLHKENETELL